MEVRELEVSQWQRDFEESQRDLVVLAEAEYHVSLAEVTTRPEDSDEHRMLRVGRLLGVMLKKQFATSTNLTTPSSYSGAYRKWTLKSASEFETPEAQNCWQYKVLEALRSDPDVIRSLGWQLASVYDLADKAQEERGFFWFFAMSCRRHLCEDPELRSQIERQCQAATEALTIGVALVQNHLALGSMDPHMIAVLVYIIRTVGFPAFCQWASDHQSLDDKFLNPDREEDTIAQS